MTLFVVFSSLWSADWNMSLESMKHMHTHISEFIKFNYQSVLKSRNDFKFFLFLVFHSFHNLWSDNIFLYFNYISSIKSMLHTIGFIHFVCILIGECQGAKLSFGKFTWWVMVMLQFKVVHAMKYFAYYFTLKECLGLKFVRRIFTWI